MNAIVRVEEAQAAPAPLAVVLPARDEAAAVAAVITEIKNLLPGVLVIVVDDASGDATARLAGEAGATVLRLPVSLGAWGAIQTGMRYALRLGCRVVVTMDSDGQHCAAEIARLLEALEGSSAGVVIGAHPQRGSRARRLAWRVFRWLSGFAFADLTSGFRAYGRRALWILASPRATLLEYQDLGVLLLLRRQGVEIAEVPVRMRPRLAGKSRVFGSWWQVAVYLFQTLLLCLGHGLGRGR